MTTHPDYEPTATEVSAISIELEAALEAADIVLPQLAAHTGGEYVVRLGDCNVRVAKKLHHLIRDGITLRTYHPGESILG